MFENLFSECERRIAAMTSVQAKLRDPVLQLDLAATAKNLHTITLGACQLPSPSSRTQAPMEEGVRDSTGAFERFIKIWRARQSRTDSFDYYPGYLDAAGDTIEVGAIAVLGQSFVPRPRLSYLSSLLRLESSWPRLLVFSQILADGWLRIGRAADAVLELARAVHAHRSMARWLRRRGMTTLPDLITEFPTSCAKALAALSPKTRPTLDPVKALVDAAAGLRSDRPPRPDRTISALDALVTLGRASAPRQFERRVARELAALVGGWVLLHKRGKTWVSLRPQSEHTLSTWSVVRLGRLREFRTIRVRPRPEFWRPEQRRPGNLLTIPFGEGVICLAKHGTFAPREVDAVRTVLRFLAARLTELQRPNDPLASPGPHPIPHLAALPSPPASSPATSARPPIAAIVSRRVPARLPGEGLIGESPAWRAVLSQVARVAESTINVLFIGETGTGKEMVARGLHTASLRHRGPFVAVNCGAFTSSLLGSELFGHVRGAFTGADRARDGLFVQAHRGTLFLDEIADMPVELQVALLRVLEEKSVRPLGAAESRAVDVRVVAACARDLDAEVAAGRFREDLFHRICVVRIDLPPLRERREDIPILAAHLAARTPEKARLHPDAIAALLSHDWPGNVRELDNVIRASAVFAEDGEIGPNIVEAVVAQRRASRRGRHAAPAATESVAQPRLDALVRAADRGWLSAGELAERVGVSARTVNRDLSVLVAAGRMRAAGEARARRYRSGADSAE